MLCDAFCVIRFPNCVSLIRKATWIANPFQIFKSNTNSIQSAVMSLEGGKNSKKGKYSFAQGEHWAITGFFSQGKISPPPPS
jgi:hypothetical protein